MPRPNLQTATSRSRLAPRGKPYRVRLLPGVHLGYRVTRSGHNSWVAIAADGKGGQWIQTFGLADDNAPADGVEVMDYEQAANRARVLARGDAHAAAHHPATFSEALIAFEADLEARGRRTYNARLVRYHLPAQLVDQSLATITTKALRHWRDAMVKSGMKAATVNRVAGMAQAAANLAAAVDPRVAANAAAWKVGLKELPDATIARNAVLTDAQVIAVVAAAYEISPAFGLWVQIHAETGARSSQLVRVTVGDLQAGRLLIPPSRKGRGRGRRDHTPVPITTALAVKLKAVAKGRPLTAPLFLRPDGGVWEPEKADHRRPFQLAAAAAGLPAGTTIYALRHSSIVRALLRGTPLSVVSRWHDTSPTMIEAHYGRFIAHHYDDAVRAALLNTSPAPAAKVVALRS